MNDFQRSLDHYLTTPPEDDFDNWAEAVTEKFSQPFYDLNDYWILQSDKCNDWMWELYRQGKTPEEAATTIEVWFVEKSGK